MQSKWFIICFKFDKHKRRTLIFFPSVGVLFAFINHFFLFLFGWCSFRTTPKKKRRRIKFTKKTTTKFWIWAHEKKNVDKAQIQSNQITTAMLKKNMMNFYIFFQISVVCFCYFVPVFLIESHFVLSLFYLHLGVSINNICFRFARFFSSLLSIGYFKNKVTDMCSWFIWDHFRTLVRNKFLVAWVWSRRTAYQCADLFSEANNRLGCS